MLYQSFSGLQTSSPNPPNARASRGSGSPDFPTLRHPKSPKAAHSLKSSSLLPFESEQEIEGMARTGTSGKGKTGVPCCVADKKPQLMWDTGLGGGLGWGQTAGVSTTPVLRAARAGRLLPGEASRRPGSASSRPQPQYGAPSHLL